MQGHEAHRAVKDLQSKATGMLEIPNQSVTLPLLLSSPSLVPSRALTNGSFCPPPSEWYAPTENPEKTAGVFRSQR
jgi:hypothetical protein